MRDGVGTLLWVRIFSPKCKHTSSAPLMRSRSPLSRPTPAQPLIALPDMPAGLFTYSLIGRRVPRLVPSPPQRRLSFPTPPLTFLPPPAPCPPTFLQAANEDSLIPYTLPSSIAQEHGDEDRSEERHAR